MNKKEFYHIDTQGVWSEKTGADNKNHSMMVRVMERIRIVGIWFICIISHGNKYRKKKEGRGMVEQKIVVTLYNM